ncbi:heterokaryon incompatibility Het-C, partial [Apodospora peruviana]
MSTTSFGRANWLLLILLFLSIAPGGAQAFGPGQHINQFLSWLFADHPRVLDVEAILTTIAFVHGKKWAPDVIKRVYFGNWLRDYSQALDFTSLRNVDEASHRVVISVLSLMAFGFSLNGFDISKTSLGVYRPEEHVHNPKNYACDISDPRTWDPRLRGPVSPTEIAVDPRTGMKNYIANESGGWATSAGYLRFSIARCIHFGRIYLCGGNKSGRPEDVDESLRCLGQALHCLEDFSANSNYCELALLELGYSTAFPHCGSSTRMRVSGKNVYPLVTGMMGTGNFLQSVSSELDQLDTALKIAGEEMAFRSRRLSGFLDRLSRAGMASPDLDDAYAMVGSESKKVAVSDQSLDDELVLKNIRAVLELGDKIAKFVHGNPRLQEKFDETLTVFVLGLLAPFVRPVIATVTKALREASSRATSDSKLHQFDPWDDSKCTDPTHSMLSKDPITNILNECAGRVAATIVQYTVPRILYAWEHPAVPVDEVANDILRCLHHPATRDPRVQIQRNMYATVEKWVDDRSLDTKLPDILSSDSVKALRNHVDGVRGWGSP